MVHYFVLRNSLRSIHIQIMNKYNLEIARELVDEYKNDIESINTIIEDIEEKIKDLNHPHISGSGIN